MNCCWINHPDGIALLDEQANLRGILIELPIQRLGQAQKRLQKPSEWFKIGGHKMLVNSLGEKQGA